MKELPLRDIHLPDPISWWPLAFGWWLLFGIILLSISLSIFIIRNKLKPSLRKEAKKALEKIEQDYRETKNTNKCLTELSSFLRRVMLSQQDDLKVGGITGKAWLEVLDKKLEESEFSKGAGQILISGPYQKYNDMDSVTELIKVCRKWVSRL